MAILFFKPSLSVWILLTDDGINNIGGGVDDTVGDRYYIMEFDYSIIMISLLESKIVW